MATLGKSAVHKAYHTNAYEFVFSALRHSQLRLGRDRSNHNTGHVSGQELLLGIRDLAQQHFGLMAISVFKGWGIQNTEDFGKIVFELIQSGQMRKNDQDSLEDFVDVYNFRTAFLDDYEIDTRRAFSRS